MRFSVRQMASVSIKVRDGSDAVSRVTGPNGDAWREDLYPLFTEGDVLDMWAHNAIANGVTDANRLDGWGDLEEGEVTMFVTDSEIETYEPTTGEES